MTYATNPNKEIQKSLNKSVDKLIVQLCSSPCRRPMPICWPLANALVFKKVRTTLGLQNSREIFVAGRSMSVQAAEFFAGLNIPVLGIFGMTETSGHPINFY